MSEEAKIRETIRLAKQEAAAASSEADLFAKMGMIGSDAPLLVGLVGAGKAAKVDRKKLEKKGKVSDFLDKHLPEIVKILLKKQKKLPAPIRTVLQFLGIGVTSWNVVVVYATAWLIKKGLDDLCRCRE